MVARISWGRVEGLGKIAQNCENVPSIMESRWLESSCAVRVSLMIHAKKLLAAFVLFAMAAPVFAHHGVAAFDASKTVSLMGTVTGFLFNNPHTIIQFEMKDSHGNVEKWEGELTSRNSLERLGWTAHSLRQGDSITLIGHPSKIGPRSFWVTKVML